MHGYILHRALPSYNIYGIRLEIVASKLIWSNHITKPYSEASRTLGLLKIALSSCSQNMKTTAYKVSILPNLDILVKFGTHTSHDVLKNVNKSNEMHVDLSFTTTSNTQMSHPSVIVQI